MTTVCSHYRLEQMPFHMGRALENGVEPDELAEPVTHLAFYAGWPAVVSAANILGDVISQES